LQPLEARVKRLDHALVEVARRVDVCPVLHCQTRRLALSITALGSLAGRSIQPSVLSSLTSPAPSAVSVDTDASVYHALRKASCSHTGKSYAHVP
jgi:hypothetical protein